MTNTESYSQQLMLLSHAIGKFLLPTFEVEITSSSQSSAFLTEITIMKDDSFIFSQHPTDWYSNVESYSLVTILTFTALSRYSACWRQCQNFAQICYFCCVQYTICNIVFFINIYIYIYIYIYNNSDKRKQCR